jgi:putative glutamine transport system substrate-binding protein
LFFWAGVMSLSLVTACGAAKSGTAAIKKTGVLKVGVNEDVPGFSLLNTETNQYEGMEIDLARCIAQEILGDENKVSFTPVTMMTRGTLLDSGEIDMVIATFTITEVRKLSYNFTAPYYTDTIGMLVKKDAGIQGIKDLDGRTIGVPLAWAATAKEEIQSEADAAGVSVFISEFPSLMEIKNALDAGRVDAFCVDISILNGYADDSCLILPERFAPQTYGIAIKQQNIDLAEELDALIQQWLSDGVIDEIVQKNHIVKV